MSATAPALTAPVAILPEHPDYDAARTAWNLAADQRPAAIVVARDVDDVIDAIDLAAELGLQVVPQGTGHLAAALPDMGRALLLKTALGSVEVDPEARIARVGAGAVWKDVVDAVTPHGLAALSGSSHDVGVLGYTLGGGSSWLARAKGLSANNVHAIELVTADGRFVRCDATQEPELFWALRGGGGNFGVVTTIELDLFPITEVFGGMTVWPIDDVRAVVADWVAWSRTAPEAVTTSLRILRPPPLPEIPEFMRDTPIVVVDGAVLAGAPEAEEMLRGFRATGTPLVDTWTTMSPAGLLDIHMDPPGPVPAMGDTLMLEDLDDAGIDAFLDAVDPQVVAPLLMAELRQLGGALARAPKGAGARDRFEGAFLLFACGVPMSPDHAVALAAGLDRVTGALRAWSTGTTYLNFAERGGEADDAFGDGVYERLQDVRGTWDPDERFLASHRIATR